MGEWNDLDRMKKRSMMEEGPIISIQIHCEQVFRALQLASSKGGRSYACMPTLTPNKAITSTPDTSLQSVLYIWNLQHLTIYISLFIQLVEQSSKHLNCPGRNTFHLFYSPQTEMNPTLGEGEEASPQMAWRQEGKQLPHAIFRPTIGSGVPGPLSVGTGLDPRIS